MSVELFLSYDRPLDWLILIEYGSVENAQPSDHWRGVSESFGFLCDSPGGSEIGFKVLDFSKFDPEAPEVAEIFEGPRFDVPVLGLGHSTAGEIVLASKPFLGGDSTINRHYFNAAMQTEGEEAEMLWRYCLQSGDLMAHFALGYTLYELGRYREAYRHLRAYTELVPSDSWAWSWLGKATEAMGDLEEAQSTYIRAITLNRELTDAPELLVRMLQAAYMRDPGSVPVPEPGGEGVSGSSAPPGMAFIGEPPELPEGGEIVMEDGVRRGDLVVFRRMEDGRTAVQRAGREETIYHVHPASTPRCLIFIRANARYLGM